MGFWKVSFFLSHVFIRPRLGGRSWEREDRAFTLGDTVEAVRPSRKSKELDAVQNRLGDVGPSRSVVELRPLRQKTVKSPVKSNGTPCYESDYHDNYRDNQDNVD